MGLRWAPSWIAAALFGLSAIALAAVTLRPAIEIREDFLTIGRRVIPWADVRRVDRTGWNAPLAVHLTLLDDTRVLVLYPGDVDSCGSLLRHLRRYSRLALLDGVPYREFWGEPPANAPSAAPADSAPTRYPLLRPEDEEEVERMFQKLKSVGRIDSRSNDSHSNEER